MYGCEHWIIKKAEHWRIDAFALWCWRRLLRVHWTARRSNQSTKGVSPGCSLEELMLTPKVQYFGHQYFWRADSFEKTRILGKFEGGRRRGWERVRWLVVSPTQWLWGWVTSGSWCWTWRTGTMHSRGSQRVAHDWATELNWYKTSSVLSLKIFFCFYELRSQSFNVVSWWNFVFCFS